MTNQELENQVFSLILTHNHVATHDECARFLEEHGSPRDALDAMAEQGMVSEQHKDKVWEVYVRKLTKVLQQRAERHAAEQAKAKVGAPTAQNGVDHEDHGPPPHKMPQPDDEPKVTVKTAKVTSPKQQGLIQRIREGKPGKELLDHVLELAQAMDATDVHVRPGEVPTIRKLSQLIDLPVPALSAEAVHESLMSVLNDSQRQNYEESFDLDFCYDPGAMGRFRVNYLNQYGGTTGVFRVVPSQVPSFKSLGLPEVIGRFTEYSSGLVLVTGPKACGKTTTLAALIDLINSTRQDHIITLEDPIEYVQPSKSCHVNQREVGNHTASFARGLRAAIREAPDVIMVGEMRDLETIALAVTAAETGNLVLGTLHTPDSVRTINRILDVFPPEQQGQIRAMLSESLRGIVSQLLIPNVNQNGMEVATEILVNTGAIANLIRDDRTYQLRGVMQTGKKAGMITLDDSLVHLAKSGRITPEAAIARAESKSAMQQQLGLPAA